VAPVAAQSVQGAISGTVTDTTGASVPDAMVKAVNSATNLEVDQHTDSSGTYVIQPIPPGSYKLTFTKEGFETETHTNILVNANRTATVDASLKVGSVSTAVEVTATPLMNQTDATSGYVVDTLTIQDTPLGTGSFTQLAILSPGVHADFLGGGGADTGLGNQAIYADGNRNSSNSFSLNGVSTNNLFNGNSTSQVGESRFVLNTGENFGAGGSVGTSSSVYGAIGQALPTPPTDAIQEISVNNAMYDASQGNNSGAHIGVLTKSGTNEIHGSAWEQFQNSDMNAAPFFRNASPAITDKVPFLTRNQFGATFGGPIKKDKVFYFLSYQGVRIADASLSTQDATVPEALTSDRSLTGIVNMINAEYPKTPITASQVSPVALALFQAKLPNGQYLIPNPQITNTTLAKQLGYDSVIQGPDSTASVDQGIASIDYAVTDKDRLTGRYYIQNNPTNSPFGAVGSLLGFPQTLQAGSDVGTISNTLVLTPTTTWEQHVGFTRLRAFAKTTSDFTPSDISLSLLGGATFPQFDISNMDPTLGKALEFGPSTSFGNGGMFQNQWEYGSTLNWVKGKHTISAGALWDHTQLNILNDNTNTDTLNFKSLETFVEGQVKSGDAFNGTATRYYRADTVGAFVNDSYKIRSNLTISAGLRWDYDGPFTEKYGRLTAFNPALYNYNAASDTIVNGGLEVAGNGSNSLMQAPQWGFAPRIGVAWNPISKLTVRAGYGIYYDRGELFSAFSPGAGAGFNGVFGVTLAPPFVSPIAASTKVGGLSAPFGTTAPPPPTATSAAVTAYLPNLAQTACGFAGCWPAGNLFGPFVFGGYDISNKLPYTQNWTFDVQYQFSNNWLLDVGYLGNHGTHEVLPVPFNQPLLATSSNPVNGQIYNYGAQNVGPLEPVGTSEFSGNAPIRVPYIGYDMNSVLYMAEGVSNYDALQVQLRKRLSMGLQFTASYTWSHALDEQSGEGLFVTGNDPTNPKANYGNADFDQTHVFLVNYSYQIPSFKQSKVMDAILGSWIVGGQTVLQSGMPFSVYDYYGSVGSLYYGTDIEIANPIVPLKPGVTAGQAQQGTTGVNPSVPYVNPADFAPTFVAAGTNGVPSCSANGGVCDNYESLFGYTGRNIFRAPFQTRFDLSLAKEFAIRERFHLRFEADAFNIFNHPDFDAPYDEFEFFPGFEPPPTTSPANSTAGYITDTIGSPRFLQLSLHLNF